MPTGLKSFKEVTEIAKEVILENNITFDELEQNTGVESQFLRILFDPKTETIENISKVFEFLKIKMVSRKLQFNPYNITKNGNIYRISRTIKPNCSMYYDRKKDKFYKFRYRIKSKNTKDVYSNIIKSEMKELIINNLSNI